MKNFKRRNRYRSNGDRGFKRNGGMHKNSTDFSNGGDFRRRNPGRNNQNASKLIEKYNELAREALSNGDKILSENYLQHADHFLRISEQQISEKISSENVESVSKKEITPEKEVNSNTEVKVKEN